MGKVGIKNLSELVENLAKAVTLVTQIAKDGVGIEDFGSLIPLISSIKDLVELDFVQVKVELKDLDVEEQEKLASTFKKYFDLEDNKLEYIIESGLDILVNLVKSIKILMDSVKTK
jgi:uncharacterized Fe-S cluster-containing radical SAM superfamily protein